MRKFVILLFVCAVSALMLFACEREQAVQPGSKQANTGTYQPRLAPPPKGEIQQNPEMSGELQRVDMGVKTFSIRVDNGMVQTFKFDDDRSEEHTSELHSLPTRRSADLDSTEPGNEWRTSACRHGCENLFNPCRQWYGADFQIRRRYDGDGPGRSAAKARQCLNEKPHRQRRIGSDCSMARKQRCKSSDSYRRDPDQHCT